MRHVLAGLAVLLLTCAASAATTVREVQSRVVAPASALPVDLVQPEGKTRWQLEALPLGAMSTVSIKKDDAGFVMETQKGDAAPARIAIGGADGERWLLPDHDPAQMKMGARVALDFEETEGGLTDRLHADVATVGIGWVDLPSGPEEVVLQRVLLFRQRAGERAMLPDLLIHRWVSPREGVLVAVSGPVASGGRTRFNIASIDVVESVLLTAANQKIYADQLYRGTGVDIKYGYDRRGSAVDPLPVSTLVPDAGVNNICDLVNLNTWDFSGATSGQETATTNTPINLAETCNVSRCGYAGVPPGGGMQPAFLERLDRNLTGTIRRDNQVVQRENRAGDVTFWLRAGTQNENVAGAFGSGETRFCFTDEASAQKAEVPIWQMAHNDAGGWYTQAGDIWTSLALGTMGSPPCEASFASGFSGTTCGTGGSNFLGSACSSGGQNFSGAQFSKVVKGGVIKLPSGHTLNAVVLRNTTEFCQDLIACGSHVNSVRTIVYYWEAPYVGAVALLRGPLKSAFTAAEMTAGAETPCTNFTTVEFTDISYGLLPPVSITAGATTGTTVALSWNPGNDTHRINGYKIYWDSDSGGSSAYAFNSVANAGQASIVGTTATISGLTPGTTYYFTVTALSNFTDPSSSIVTQYESIKYPTTVSGDPSFSYPIEVTAATTGGGCVPTLAVNGLTVDKALPNVHVCWTATADACAMGYDVLASDDATSDVGWSVAGQVGLTTCWDGNASQKFLLVRSRGTGGTGPWGHYQH